MMHLGIAFQSDIRIRKRTEHLYLIKNPLIGYESWPSILERRLKKRVINGGVTAYGLDQSFLRLKVLLEIYHPDTVIFSFIPPDLVRSEYSVTVGANKPYFEVVNNSLLLRGSPVRKAEKRKTKSFHYLAGYSLFIHTLMMKHNPNWWIQGGYAWSENHRGVKGEDIACSIFRELPSLLKEKNIERMFVLIQYPVNPFPELRPKVEFAVQCIDRNLITVIDLKEPLTSLRKRDPEQYNSLFQGHMSYAGNAFVAEHIIRTMEQTQGKGRE
jgi:hypothetical protein